MRYKTKVTIITGGREYQPGAILSGDISSADLRFLKSKGFVVPVDMEATAADSYDKTVEEDSERDFFGFHETEPDILKSPEEIRKIRSKKDVFTYAASMGLDLGENYEEKGLKELQGEVINFQEEQMEA